MYRVAGRLDIARQLKSHLFIFIMYSYYKYSSMKHRKYVSDLRIDVVMEELGLLWQL